MAGFGLGRPQYSTLFNTDEAELSEGGIWKRRGVDWTGTVVSGGVAFGSQTGSNGFDDTYFWTANDVCANVRLSATLKKGATSGIHEWELHFRGSDGPHYAYVYECNLAQDGSYQNVYRWPGALGTTAGQFVQLAGGSVPSVSDGDVFSAQIVGNTLTTFLNGSQILSVDVTAGAGADLVLTGKRHGGGFYREAGSSAANQLGFKDFSLVGL